MWPSLTIKKSDWLNFIYCRFWDRGYWKNFLGNRKYHISALYRVDLKRFRQLAAGDRLRGQYQALSQVWCGCVCVHVHAYLCVGVVHIRFTVLLFSLPFSPLSSLCRTQTPWLTWTKTSLTTWSTPSPSTPCLRNGSGARRGAAMRPRNMQRPLTWWEGEMEKTIRPSACV